MTQIGFKSSTGVRRSNNEDACFVLPSYDVYVVADGVGGNNAGEIASRTAVRGIAEYVDKNPIGECQNEDEIHNYFNDCLNQVNHEIYLLGERHRENKGMATTVVIAYLKEHDLHIANIGDSRAYLFSKGKLSQITEDHTYVNELVKNGAITLEEAKAHNHRNVITRAVGAEPTIQADFYKQQVDEEDIVLLCSDGLYEEVETIAIKNIMRLDVGMSAMCNRLVDEAIKCGGRDNITVVCLKV